MPVEALIMLRNNLDALPVRSAERRLLVQEVAHLHGVSLSTVRRALSQQHALQTVHRTDFNLPRILPTSEMELYCELVAALQQRTENKKRRHLSTKECIRLLEGGVNTPQGTVIAPADILKRSTVNRYLKRWGYDRRMLTLEPPWVPFQAVHSNDCWQFDFSPSDLKKLNSQSGRRGDDRTLMLASVVDDRSGVCYQEYHYVLGEDAMTALRFLYNAMAPKPQSDFPFGCIPKILLLDNGPVAKSKLFRRVMTHLGIEVRTHMPAGSDGRRTTARSKGKVERSFRTVKESLETLYHFHEPESLEEANEWLRQYLRRYNAMTHRHERHSRLEDWLRQAPTQGLRAMCDWDRFCSFVREPETRKVGGDACVTSEGVRYQLSPEMACLEVTLLWGLLDQELHVEFQGVKSGPYYPAAGPVPLDTYRKLKKSAVQKRADRISDLAKHISVPRSALSGITSLSTRQLLDNTEAIASELPSSIPFELPASSLDALRFSNPLEAKLAIATQLGYPLSRLTSAQMVEIDRLLAETLDKKTVLTRMRMAFATPNSQKASGAGDDSCTEK
ncbi:DDE-type integrase/transposase/recombinase [Pseudomonas syringae group genomosp. 3]|uniref:DDE-type integrase/transposase/recombinase n=1 Tax=Pseudomonas syringae group genomosp. 3 TaxID=251701 RepID=UPI001F46E251|nr:DDE-type integrase/transposase/recombinase [Pseudomonas syringae group genomosp. 3]